MTREARRQNAQRIARPLLGTVSLAVSAVLLQAGIARADAQQDALEEIIVSGIRHSIESSIATKKESGSIVESVTAEDIGKLPDQSIAESIARLPGLAAQRIAGKAQEISLRGLSSDFTVTLLNGRELVSTGNNRGIEYDQYPSELISAVTVYKTPDAALGTQGLAGTINLQTIRPLDAAGRIFVVNGRAEHNSYGALNSGVSGNGNRASISYADKFMDGKLGLALNLAHLDSPEQEKWFEAWWYGPGVNEDATGNAWSQLGAEAHATSAKQKRDAVMAVIDVRPNDNLRSTLDLYYSKYDVERTNRALLWESAGAGWGDTVRIHDPSIVHTPNFDWIESGYYSGVQPVEQSNFDTQHDKLFAAGLNTALTAGNWVLDSDLSYSDNKRRVQTFEMYAGLGNAADGIMDDHWAFHTPFGSPLSTFTPSRNLADPAAIFLADPGGWGQDGFMRQPRVDDSLSTLRLSAKRSLSSFFSNVEAGVMYSSRRKERADNDFQYFLKNGGAKVLVDSSLLQSPTSLDWVGVPGILAYDIMGALGRYFDTPIKDTTQADDWYRNYTIREKATTMFARFDISSHVGSVPLHGNLGVQVVHTNQSSTSIMGQNHNLDITGGTSYNNVLPSLNLNFDLSQLKEDLHLRVAAARSMARPRTDDMMAGTNAAVSEQAPHLWSGQAGNPKLHPWIADGIDVSLEQYFGKRSYVAAAAFQKRLKTYIYTVTELFDFAGFPNPNGVQPENGNTIGNLSHPINGKGGSIDGTEFSMSLDGSLVSSRLDGLGLIASYELTSSSIQPYPAGSDIGDVTITVPGLSRQVSNVTAYFEKGGFSARISRRYRGSWRGRDLGAHGDPVEYEYQAEGILDAQLSYEFQSGRAKGLSLILQGNNLRDTPSRTRYISLFGQSVDAPSDYKSYGRQILFGVNYKLP